MDKRSFRDQLDRLKSQIEEARRGNPRSGETLGEIQRLLEASRDAPHPSLAQRLEGLAVQFEAEHPTLAASARRLVDLLGEVGI